MTAREKRLKLQTMLEEILGSRNVYFQPPENIKMRYPAIRYDVNNIDNDFADDAVYKQTRSYEIIVIDRDPDSEIVDKISKLPTCRYGTRYESDGLNHTTFTINY